ncbi:MAG: cyclic nucleotide-binding domain-containing protein [Acidobacteria bacterium]|nr:cyclic nucleotide-binding domain-containing protein [Acidobacteriota bacterium]MCA1609984.1 cyclic nucleotide-binding domain-containing protein [Acidobacteriota bacterium]
MKSDSLAVLASTELFGSLDASDLERLGPELEWLRLPGGELLFQQGEIGECLYVVVNGRLRVLRERPNASDLVLGEIGYGETVGEMALLTGARRSATVRAVRDAELLRLSEESFNRLLATHPQMTMLLARRIITRYQHSMQGSQIAGAGTVATIALVPAGPGTSIAGVARSLTTALEAIGPVLHLDSARLDRELGPGASQIPKDHSRNHAIVSWLNEQESKYRFLLYEVDTAPSAWTSRCIRQADRVLLVARSDGAPELGAVEIAMSRQGADLTRKELVLLHPAREAIYPGTSKWLAERRIDRIHHVVEDGPKDYDRIVRFLTGRATGVVLGGGGARSFAQIGMLKALAEAGVTIDLVGGTSMGAFLGAQVAMGWSIEQMLEYNKRTWRNRHPIRDYTFPYIALISGRRFTKVGRDLYGEAQIEDLALNYFCCSSNLTRATVMVHRRGTLWRALGASIAVPGLAPPLFENGDLFVDGAMLDNLPIDIMREACDGPVVAMDVSPAVDLAVDPNLREGPSAWRMTYRRFRPVAGETFRLPSIMEILSRASSLGSVAQVERLKRQANLYLQPPLDQYSIFSFKSIEELAQAGYDYASPAIQEWKAATEAAAHHPIRVMA